MSTSQVLQLLCTLGKSSPDFLRSLYTFIRLDGEGEYSHNLPQPESIRLVNFLDEVRPNHCETRPACAKPLTILGARCDPSDRPAVPTLSPPAPPYLRSPQRVAVVVHHT